MCDCTCGCPKDECLPDDLCSGEDCPLCHCVRDDCPCTTEVETDGEDGTTPAG